MYNVQDDKLEYAIKVKQDDLSIETVAFSRDSEAVLAGLGSEVRVCIIKTYSIFILIMFSGTQSRMELCFIGLTWCPLLLLFQPHSFLKKSCLVIRQGLFVSPLTVI